MSGTQQQTTETTQSNEIAPYVEAGSMQAVDMARDIASQPFSAYSGERVVGLDPLEQQGYNLAATSAGSYQPYLDQAADLADRATTSFTDADIGAYMNPYLENAMEPALREAREDMARAQTEARAAAQRASAFGGSRATLLESEALRSGQEQLNDIRSQGYYQAYQDASNRFEMDRAAFSRGAEQFRGLGEQRQRQLFADIAQMMSAGAAQRGVDQARADFDFGEFTREIDWDIRNLQPLLQALSTVPFSTSTTGEQTTSTDSDPFGQLLGLSAIAAGAMFGGPAGAAAGGSVASSIQGGGAVGFQPYVPPSDSYWSQPVGTAVGG